MFDFVHKHRIVIQIFLSLIALTFAVWGIESYTRFRGSSDTVAEVNGIKITQREFDEELRRQQDQLRRMFGANYDPAVLDTADSRRALVDGMITQRLIGYTAYKSNLVVPDEMLVETIESIQAFQNQGKFDKTQYEMVLKAQNPPLTPAQFESRLRNDLALQELSASLGGTAIASRTVADRLTALETQKREASEALIPAEQYLSRTSVEEAKLKAYYDGHPDEFRVPERVRAEYVVLSADALAKQETVSDDEIKKAYEARASEFKVPEQRRASHILVKDKAEAEKLLAQVRKDPKSFGELAKKYSQDTGSAEKGGDLGWFGPGMMVKPFEDAVFSMKKEGEIAGPVKSDFGYHIIRLTGVQSGKSRSLDEVRKQIADGLAKQKGERKFNEAAENFSNMVYEQSDSLKPVADRYKLEIHKTPWIAKSAGQELGPLDNPKLLAALFSTDAVKNHRNTDAIEVAPQTLVSARVADYQPATQRSFAEAKAEIADKLRRAQAIELAQKDGEAKLAALRKGGDAGLKWTAPKMVSRRDPQGLPPEVLQQVVSADASKLPAYGGLPVPGKGYAIVRVTKVVDSDPKQTEQQNVEHAEQLYGATEYQAYLESLRQQAKIDVNQENLEKKLQ